MRWLLLSLLLLAGHGVAGPVQAERLVKVAGTYFPPYVQDAAARKGLLIELLGALNQIQSDYRFVVVPTAIPRRFADLQAGRIDMVMFDNPQWGWGKINHEVIDLGMQDAALFVALAPREESYFDTLQGKRLALYRDYSYRFADFVTDPERLRERFAVALTYSHEGNLLMVLNRRAEIAVVTRSFLEDFLQRNPQYRDRLHIAQKIDQYYDHRALLRPDGPISAQELENLLESLRTAGVLESIFQPLGIVVRPPATRQASCEAKTGVAPVALLSL
jgi:ABC-type amino acid transport substrate-binding protein